MVACTYDIDVLLLEYVEGISSLGIGCIIKAVSFYSVASIDNQKILAIYFSLLAHARGEGDVIAPVSGKGGPRVAGQELLPGHE